MKKPAFYSKFWMILAFSVFLCTVSGTISPVWGQFDFGDDDTEESSDEESSDGGGFSFGDDDDEEDSDSSDDDEADSEDSMDSDDLEEDGENVGNSGDDDDVETEDSGLFSDNDSEKADKAGKSAAKSDVIPFASNGSKAGEEAILKFHGVEYRFRWCPAGSFLMGSPTREASRKVNEKQMEAVVPHGFWMLETEVTMQMFMSFVKATGYKTDAERDTAGAYHVDVPSGKILGPDPGFSWKKTGFHLERDFPVSNISWYDAQKFVEWINEGISTHEDPIDSKRQVRLPTEMQWEYACRAGTVTSYGCGEKMQNLITHANLREVNQNVTLTKSGIFKFTPWNLPYAQDYRYSAPVASMTPNAWGLYDMHGNVWEWCEDGFADYDQALIPTENSSDLQKFIGRVGPAVRGLKVTRGGGWNTDFHFARSAYRGSNPPSRRFVDLGFRFIILPMEVEKVRDDSEDEEETGSATNSLFGGDDEDDAEESKKADDDSEYDEDSGDDDEGSGDDDGEENEEDEEETGDDDDDDDDGGFDF